MKLTRRETLVAIGGSFLISPMAVFIQAVEKTSRPIPHIATNTYPWHTFSKRNSKKLVLHTDSLLKKIASTGIKGYEPIIVHPDECKGLGERLARHQLEMRSIYVNSTLHDPQKVDDSIAQVIAIAKVVRKLGTKIIVTNPSPIKWGGAENKNDKQIRFQAKALDGLGAKLRKLGITLAYHNHDAELRQGGREFHHMLTATHPDNVKFCLDAHWVFRGCGDSEVALFDALEHYHERIVELHLRQSTTGVWTEAFASEGDIDYTRLFKYLSDKSITPHFVLEQAVEQKSPNQLNVVDAHTQSCSSLNKTLKIV